MVSNVEAGVPRGRGGWSAFRGKFVRQFLIDNGPSVPTAMFQAYQDRIAGVSVTSGGAPWRVATWKSFWVWFKMAAKLGLVVKLDETEAPEGSAPFLNRRTIWDLTALGRTDEDLWTNVQQSLHPLSPEQKREYSAAARERKKVRRERLVALGVAQPVRPRGRPRREEIRPEPPIEAEIVVPEEEIGIPGVPPEFDELEQIFNLVAVTPPASQDAARLITENLRALGIGGNLLGSVEDIAESSLWRGGVSERREATLEFQATVRTLRRLLELQGRL